MHWWLSHPAAITLLHLSFTSTHSPTCTTTICPQYRKMSLRDRVLSLLFQRCVFCCVAVCYSLGLLYIAFHDERGSPTKGTLQWVFSPPCPLEISCLIAYRVVSPWHSASPPSSVVSVIPSLYQSFLLNYTTENLTTGTGEIFTLPFQENGLGFRFTEPLGSKLVILDAETRPLDGPGGILNTTWSDMEEEGHSQTMGRLSHYLFGKGISIC